MILASGRPRAMLFVDGSNFLIELFSQLGVEKRAADRPPVHAINLAHQVIQASVYQNFLRITEPGPHTVLRKYWFGSIQGSEEFLDEARVTLRNFGFEPVLFHKRKGRDEKGVDLAVAREMLIHAFNRNYDTAVLVAGDEDYEGLLQDLKRLGIVVVGSFFEGNALSPKLRIAFDRFAPMIEPQAVNAELAKLVRGLPPGEEIKY